MTVPNRYNAGGPIQGVIIEGAASAAGVITPIPSGSATDPEYTSPTAANDPVFDNANGTKTSLTTNATIITPPAGCKWIRISTDVDIFINTANTAAVDDGTSSRIVANSPEYVPVTAGLAVKGLSSSGSATVRCTPLKARP